MHGVLVTAWYLIVREFTLHSYTMGESSSATFCWIFRELTRFRACLYESMRILDVLLRAAVVSASLVLTKRLRSLPIPGAIFHRNAYFLYGFIFFYDKRVQGRPIVDKYIYIICLLEELTPTYARNIKQEFIFAKMFHTPKFLSFYDLVQLHH